MLTIRLDTVAEVIGYALILAGSGIVLLFGAGVLAAVTSWGVKLKAARIEAAQYRRSLERIEKSRSVISAKGIAAVALGRNE